MNDDEFREVYERLQRTVEALAAENAKRRARRSIPFATPAQEEEMRLVLKTAVPDGLKALIAELEAGLGSSDAAPGTPV